MIEESLVVKPFCFGHSIALVPIGAIGGQKSKQGKPVVRHKMFPKDSCVALWSAKKAISFENGLFVFGLLNKVSLD